MTRGEQMKQARMRAGLTRKRLAEISGGHQNTIVGVEQGIVQGNIATIELLADALGISIDEYIGHKPTKPKHKDNVTQFFGL